MGQVYLLPEADMAGVQLARGTALFCAGTLWSVLPKVCRRLGHSAEVNGPFAEQDIVPDDC